MTTAPIVPESLPPTSFRVGDWEVRPASAELVHAGEVVRLEPRVMSVLVCLAQHSPNVVRRQDLLREVWGGAFVGEDVIWRCISDLRRAFGDDARQMVETLPRLGYRLLGEVTLLPATPTPTPADPPAPQRAGHRRQRALALGGTVAALALVVLVAAWLAAGAKPRSSETPGTPRPDGGTTAAIAPGSAADLVRQGDQFYWRTSAKDKMRAADFYERALAVDPRYAPAWAGLAGTASWRFVDGGDPAWIEKALAEAQRAIALDPRLVAGYKALAQAETMRGRLGSAVQASLQALEIEPGATVVEYNLGCIHAQRGELDRATTLFRRNPLIASGPPAIACEYARALRLLGAAPEARALAEATLAREPFDPCSTWVIASLDMDRGLLTQPLAAVEKALEVTPDAMPLLAVAAELEQALGRTDAAIAHLRHPALSKTPLAQVRLAGLLRPESVGEARALLAGLRAAAEARLRAGDESWEPRLVLATADGVEGAGAGELAHLTDAVAHGFSDLVTLRTDPLFAAARGEAGFADLERTLAARLAEQRARSLLPAAAAMRRAG